MKNLPNAITLLRLLLVPVIAVLLAEQRFGAAFAVFVIGGISDGVDGMLARRLHAESQVGLMLDPVADKLFVMSTAFVLAWQGALPWWVAAALIVRDVLILAPLVIDPRFKDHWPSPNRMGKLHTAFALLVLSATIAQAAGWFDLPDAMLVLQIALMATLLLSLGFYARVWLRT
jgi:cardiolipin synthase